MNVEIPVEIPQELIKKPAQSANSVDMNAVVGSHDILFLCLDTLRWDVAQNQESCGGTPVLNRYGKWQKCFSPGNFTYPSHHAMFAGFLPAPIEARTITDREMLFFPKSIGMGRFSPPHSFAFDGATIMEGLANVGYETLCIGGVSFFDKRSPIGSVFPAMFKHSYWRPAFACGVKESADHQVDFAISKLAEFDARQRIFLYINLSAIHYPNYFYIEGASKNRDNVETHAAALRYVDSVLGRLFKACERRAPTFVIATSDHGTCYGEEGFQFHGLPNEIVDTIPYKHFFL